MIRKAARTDDGEDSCDRSRLGPATAGRGTGAAGRATGAGAGAGSRGAGRASDRMTGSGASFGSACGRNGLGGRGIEISGRAGATVCFSSSNASSSSWRNMAYYPAWPWLFGSWPSDCRIWVSARTFSMR